MGVGKHIMVVVHAGKDTTLMVWNLGLLNIGIQIVVKE
jgi:hypothetical protein